MLIALLGSFCVPVHKLNAQETEVLVEPDIQATGVVAPASSVVLPSTQSEMKRAIENSLVVKKKKCIYPKQIYEGQAFSVGGTLRANHKIQKVKASITQDDGEQACVVEKKAESTSFDLKNVNKKMKFSELTSGNYCYEVEVTDTYGNQTKALEKEFKVKEVAWKWPVENGKLGDSFRCKCSVHRGKHYGIDIVGVSTGTSIHAVRDGKVVYSKYHAASRLSSFGKLVILYHGDGIYSYYAHCNTLKCKVGDVVEQGDVIATVGATGGAYGKHLHLELRRGPEFNGRYNYYKLLDKYTYKQFDPMKKNYLTIPS